MLPAMEFAPLAAVESGGDPAAAQRALFDWFRPILIASGIIFGAGAVFFAVSITRSAALGPRCHTVGCGSLGHHGAVSLRALVSSPVLRAGPGLLCGDAAACVRHVAAFRVRSGVARGVAADNHRTGRRLTAALAHSPPYWPRVRCGHTGSVEADDLLEGAATPAWQRIIRGTRVMARTVNDPLQRVSFGARAAQPDLAAVVDELGVQVTDGLQTGLGHTYDT